MNRRVALLLSSCVVSAAIMAGCSSNNDQSAQTPPAGGASTPAKTSSGGKQLHLAFVTNNASDYWTIARKGVEKADGELDNVTVEFKMPGQGTAAEQTQLVDDLLSKGADGFAISPVDPANQTDLLNRASKQALVFTQDSDAPKSNRVCYIGTDNVAAGRMAGEQVKKALPAGGKIMVFVGKKDAQNATERYKGLQEALKGSKVQIIDIRTDDTDHAKAKSNVSDALVKYGDLAGCVGLWSYNGPAIVSAVKDAGKIGKVKIVAFDEEDDTLAGVKSGAIFATIVQQPYEFGYRSVVNMSKYLNGDKSVVPASKSITVPTLAIDKTKVDAFKANLDKLRGRA
jgi:ribose transport system substrate-binding protein